MSVNCIKCVVNRRTGIDLLCDQCRLQLTKPTAMNNEQLTRAIRAEVKIQSDSYRSDLMTLATDKIDELRKILAFIPGKIVDSVGEFEPIKFQQVQAHRLAQLWPPGNRPRRMKLYHFSGQRLKWFLLFWRGRLKSTPCATKVLRLIER